MSYVPEFFLVFAGMLIGYFLWYRDRTEDEQLRLSQARESEELRTALASAHNSNSLLEERFVRQKGQLNVLQQLCDEWSTTREQAERDRVHLEIEVDDKRKKYDAAVVDLQRTKQKQHELEDKLHALGLQQQEKINQREAEWNQKHSRIEASLTQRQSELKSAVQENERLSRSLHQAEARTAALKSEIESQQKLLETATRNAGGLKQEYVSLESSLRESSGLLKQSRTETATAVSEKKVAEQSLTALQERYQKQVVEAEQLRDRLNAMNALEQEVVTLKKSIESNQEQLDHVTQQRDLALQAETKTVTMAAGLQTRLSNQESTIHSLREKHKDSLEQAKRELQARVGLESSLDQQKQELLNAKREINKLEDAQLERDDRIKLEVENLLVCRRRIAELEQQVVQWTTHSQSREDELKKMRQQFAAAEIRQTEMQAKIENHAVIRQQFDSLKLDYAAKIESLTLKLKSSEETIRGLRRERAGVLGRLANYRTIAEPDATVISFKQAMQERLRTNYDQEYGGHTEHHDLRGVVYTSEPEFVDDLKRISGVAEVLEARLNDFGIYTFKQIMEWKPAAIEEFSRLLAFRDRIQRDDWQGQAKYFYQQKLKQQPSAA